MTVLYFDELFLTHYAADPAAAPGRLEPALDILTRRYAPVQPEPGRVEDILLVHSRRHLDYIAADEPLYSAALLAAGATVQAAETAARGEFSFALCRPPGHHASPDSCWGFCYFNNVAVAVQKLLDAGQASSVLIVDFDLHYGDGTDNIFRGRPAVSYWHSREGSGRRFLAELEECLAGSAADLAAVSAGFDRHVDDWGGMLTTRDYRTIGSLLGAFARDKCNGRLFAALEGGYNASSLADSIDAFLEGLEQP